jgi:hypothetical protein
LRNTKPADLAPHLIGTKGHVGKPTPTAAPNEPLNFKMSPAFKREFKMAAVSNGLRLNELLVEAFEAWKKGRGDDRQKGGEH